MLCCSGGWSNIKRQLIAWYAVTDRLYVPNSCRVSCLSTIATWHQGHILASSSIYSVRMRSCYALSAISYVQPYAACLLQFLLYHFYSRAADILPIISLARMLACFLSQCTHAQLVFSSNVRMRSLPIKLEGRRS
jgi:hypothetical protein